MEYENWYDHSNEAALPALFHLNNDNRLSSFLPGFPPPKKGTVVGKIRANHC
jgi:hypothetical protein